MEPMSLEEMQREQYARMQKDAFKQTAALHIMTAMFVRADEQPSYSSIADRAIKAAVALTDRLFPEV